MIRFFCVSSSKPPGCEVDVPLVVVRHKVQYPLVTHTPNMLEKVTGELGWEIKSDSFRREIPKFEKKFIQNQVVYFCAQFLKT